MCNRPIRVVNPEELRIYSGRTVSVGEAAGVVFPVTGEGIIPSMESCEILKDSLFYSGVTGYDFRKDYEIFMKIYLHAYDYYKAFKVWKLMEKHPRTAWLKGFRFMLKRTKARAQPELTPLNLLRVMVKLMCGR